jgi:hypothetical protein
LEVPSADGRIILECVLKKEGGSVEIGFIGFRREISG